MSYRAELADSIVTWIANGSYSRSLVVQRFPRNVKQLEEDDNYNVAVVIGPRVLSRINRKEYQHNQTLYIVLQKHMEARNDAERLVAYDEALRVSEEVEARMQAMDSVTADDVPWVKVSFEAEGSSKSDMEQEPMLTENTFEDVIEVNFQRSLTV